MTAVEASQNALTLVEERVAQLIAEHPPATTDPSTFLGAQFDLGLAWVQFDEGSGGLGLPPSLQEEADRALRRAGAPHPAMRNPIGYGMGAPDRDGPRHRGPEAALPAAAVHR